MDKSVGWGTTLLSCVLQSRSWCSEPCHEFRTTWPLVLLSYKDTRSELTAHLILPHESSIAHPPISGVRINYDDEVAWFLHHATRHCEPSTWKLVNSMIWMFTWSKHSLIFQVVFTATCHYRCQTGHPTDLELWRRQISRSIHATPSRVRTPDLEF